MCLKHLPRAPNTRDVVREWSGQLGLMFQSLNTVVLALLPRVASVRLQQLWRALISHRAKEGCPTERG